MGARRKERRRGGALARHRATPWPRRPPGIEQLRGSLAKFAWRPRRARPRHLRPPPPPRRAAAPRRRPPPALGLELALADAEYLAGARSLLGLAASASAAFNCWRRAATARAPSCADASCPRRATPRRRRFTLACAASAAAAPFAFGGDLAPRPSELSCASSSSAERPPRSASRRARVDARGCSPCLLREPLLRNGASALELALDRLVQPHLGLHLAERRLLGDVARAHALVERGELRPQRDRVLLVLQQLGHLLAQVGHHKLLGRQLLLQRAHLRRRWRRWRRWTARRAGEGWPLTSAWGKRGRECGG